jgi:plasmid segregation protein ParM
MDYCDSLEMGIIKMYNQILTIVNAEYDMLLEEKDIDSIMQGELKYYDQPIITLVEKQVENYISDLLASIRERGIDTKSTYTIFIGGGALRLKKYIEMHSTRLNRYKFIDNIHANAIGYELLYKMLQDEEK